MMSVTEIKHIELFLFYKLLSNKNSMNGVNFFQIPRPFPRYLSLHQQKLNVQMLRKLSRNLVSTQFLQKENLRTILLV